MEGKSVTRRILSKHYTCSSITNCLLSHVASSLQSNGWTVHNMSNNSLLAQIESATCAWSLLFSLLWCFWLSLSISTVRKHLIFVKSSLILMPIGAQEATSPRRLCEVWNRNRMPFRIGISIRWNIVLRSSIPGPNVKERFEVQRVIPVLDLSISLEKK